MESSPYRVQMLLADIILTRTRIPVKYARSGLTKRYHADRKMKRQIMKTVMNMENIFWTENASKRILLRVRICVFVFCLFCFLFVCVYLCFFSVNSSAKIAVYLNGQLNRQTNWPTQRPIGSRQQTTSFRAGIQDENF